MVNLAAAAVFLLVIQIRRRAHLRVGLACQAGEPLLHSIRAHIDSSIHLEVALMTTKLDRITVDPEIMNGQPCIRGMRLTVRRVVQAIALYPDRKDLKAEYPELQDEDIAQALEYAARNLEDAVMPVEAA